MRKIKTAISAICLLLALISTPITFAQMGGTNSYSILNMKHNARNAALGLDFLPSFCDDIGVAISNPSSISPLNHGNISLSYTNFFGEINQASIASAYSTKNIGTFALGLQYLNYGNFDMTEENGDVTGRFTAADYVFVLSWNKMLDSNIYIGANLKPVFCQYESYSSSAIAIDLGASYQSDDRTWALSFLARNMGTQITKFALADATLPFELQLTASKKLAHAPFVVYLGLNNLQKWNIREEDPLNPRDEVDLSGNIRKENKFAAFTDNLFRHVQAGVEFVPSQHFYIALGYSWKQNREMNLTDAFSIAGLSYGFGINYRQFRIAYSRCEYHRYGSPNFVSLLIKL